MVSHVVTALVSVWLYVLLDWLRRRRIEGGVHDYQEAIRQQARTLEEQLVERERQHAVLLEEVRRLKAYIEENEL